LAEQIMAIANHRCQDLTEIAIVALDDVVSLAEHAPTIARHLALVPPEAPLSPA